MSDTPDFDDPKFNGPEYDPDRDNARLTGQILRVFNYMKPGHWRTVEEIGNATGDPQASVSAQLRHLRKPRFGSFTVNRRARGGAGHLHEYKLVVPGPHRPEQGKLL